MKPLKSLLSLLAFFSLSALVACGGGGGSAGTSIVGGGPGTVNGVNASDLVLVLSANSVANSGLESVVATATALDGRRNAIAGIPVSITVDSNAIATPSGTTTGAEGTVTAAVGIGADRTNRTITVTARSGSIVRTVALAVTSATGTATASDLVLVLSAASIANNGTQTVTATATALDAKRNVLPGVGVSVTVDSNAVISPAGTTTDGTGSVKASVGIGADRSNRNITVTATSGSLSRTAVLQVADTTTGVPTAADLSLVLSGSSLTNGGTSTLVATATAVDVNRNAVGGIPVTIKVDSSAVANVSGPTTNVTGVVTANVGIGADRSNRVVTVTASSGTLTRSASFRVIGADLTASFTPLVDTNSANNRIEYKLVDTNAIAMAGQTISVTAPGLPSQSGSTDLNGKYVYTFTAPNGAGPVIITASGAGDSESSTISVQTPGGGSIAPASSAPQSASVAPSPSVVSINSLGSNTNQAELRALFLGADNAPIARVRVRFDLDGNATSSDGVTAPLSGFAYSDATGVARGSFTPGQRSSPTNGVTIRACYDIVDFPLGTCPNVARATLTVASEALSVNIRTNELIKSGAANLTYIKEFVVMVVDAAGQAKPDVLITPSIDLTGYQKGFWIFDVASNRWVRYVTLADSEHYTWSGTGWVNSGATGRGVCPNEDFNRNAVLETGEDLNGNKELDPRKADVAVKMVGSPKTDTNGLAILQIEYGRNLASWVDFVITVTASGVAGTEVRAKYIGLDTGLGNLPYPADAVTSRDIAPAFSRSPYGGGGSYTIVAATPTSPAVLTVIPSVCTDDK